jgi:hypothetical protein
VLTALTLQDVELLYVPVTAVFFCRNISIPIYVWCVCVSAWVLFDVRVEGRVERKICSCV